MFILVSLKEGVLLNKTGFPFSYISYIINEEIVILQIRL